MPQLSVELLYMCACEVETSRPLSATVSAVAGESGEVLVCSRATSCLAATRYARIRGIKT